MSALRDCKQKHIGTAVPFSIGCYSKKASGGISHFFI